MGVWETLLEAAGGRCNCENGGCEKLGDHRAGACPRPAGEAKALYIGNLCDQCAQLMPKEYLMPPHGTARG